MNSIAEIRKKSDISQDELANKLGWSPQILSHYETGRRTPSLVRSRRIVKALNELGIECDIDIVFPESTESNSTNSFSAEARDEDLKLTSNPSLEGVA